MNEPMTIDLFIFQLAIIFLPGLIWARLDAVFVAKPKPSELESVVRAFLFGLASYGATFLVYHALGWQFVLADFSKSGSTFVVNGAMAAEIVWTIGIGLLLSVFWIYSATYKFLARFLQLIQATKRYGNEDIWDFTFNSRGAAVEYVNFRDFANGIVYCGWVRGFSETDKLRELVLRDVDVYAFSGDKLFNVPLLYLARSPDNIHIEFPYRP